MTKQIETGFEVIVIEPFEQAIERVTTALKSEGFGILTRIDVHSTFKEKLNVDFRKYTILGACNPPLAYKSLSSDPTVGLLLPCNVTVESEPNGGSIVRIVNPLAMFQVGDFTDPAIQDVAQQAAERLQRVHNLLKQ